MSIRCLLALLSLVFLSVLPACTSSGNAVTFADFSMNFTGFTPHIGQTFYLKLKDASNGSTVGTMTPLVLTTDAFNVSIPDSIVEGKVYNVDFFADMDASGAVPDLSPTGTPAGVDHTWRVTATGTPTGLTLTFVHDLVWTDITPF